MSKTTGPAAPVGIASPLDKPIVERNSFRSTIWRSLMMIGPERASRCRLVLLLIAGCFPTAARAADLERAPIRYSEAPANNVVTRLEQRLDEGKARLTYEEGFGYLRSLLRELNVPASSQMLVFSKTSLQRQRISPRKPRALYFSDDVYVGFCQQGDLIEVTAVDPDLGAVFYSLEQKPAARPRFVRQQDACLICHASSQNQGFP